MPISAERSGELADFATEPVLAIASLLLVVVSVAWLLVYLVMMRRARRGTLGVPLPRSPRDIWRYPP